MINARIRSDNTRIMSGTKCLSVDFVPNYGKYMWELRENKDAEARRLAARY